MILSLPTGNPGTAAGGLLNHFNGLECHASAAVAYICGTCFNFYEKSRVTLQRHPGQYENYLRKVYTLWRKNANVFSV